VSGRKESNNHYWPMVQTNKKNILSADKKIFISLKMGFALK